MVKLHYAPQYIVAVVFVGFFHVSILLSTECHLKCAVQMTNRHMAHSPLGIIATDVGPIRHLYT